MKVGFFFSLFYFLKKEESGGFGIGFLGSEEFRIKNLPRMKLFAESRQTSEKLDAASLPPRWVKAVVQKNAMLLQKSTDCSRKRNFVSWDFDSSTEMYLRSLESVFIFISNSTVRAVSS